jgi:hypothetical protein
MAVCALIDSSATGCFIDKDFTVDQQISMSPLDTPILIQNTDGTNNWGSPIEYYINIWLQIQPPAAHNVHKERLKLEVTKLANDYQVILGLPWLQVHNPSIDWQAATIDFDQCAHPTMIAVTTKATTTMNDNTRSNLNTSSTARPVPTKHTSLNKSNKTLVRTTQMHIDSQSALSRLTPDELLPPPSLNLSDWQQQHRLWVTTVDHSRSTTVEEDMKSFVPKKYHKYKDIFMKTSFNALPEHSEFDHAINLTDNFTPQKSVIYKLSPLEQQELNKFLNENLSTGHIQHSKSKQAAPFFFAKKAPKINAPNQNPGLQPIIDYCYLNAHTVKDRYSLPYSKPSSKHLNFKQRLSSLFSTFARDSITFVSRREMNGKQHLSRTEEYSNPRLCFLAYAIPCFISTND